MKFVCYADKNITDSDLYRGYDEVILPLEELSRHGTWSLSEGESIAAILSGENRIILDWDILLTEDGFSHYDAIIKGIDLELFSAIRVQDIGILQYVLEHTDLPIQLVLDAGNRNTPGILKWVELVGKRLDRLILSPELSREDLERIRQAIKCPLEILGLGKILLFYSPRNLLSPLFTGKSGAIEAEGKSEESPHRGFVLIENQHGTFMYNPKDLNVMTYLDDLKTIGIDFLRVDNRGLGEEQQTRLMNKNFSEFVENHQRPMIKGFFHKNKTDILFKKLKNQKLQERNKNYIGDIVDVIKNQQLALNKTNQSRSLKVGDYLQMITPEGKEKEFQITSLLDCVGRELREKEDEGLVIIPYPANLSVKTAVFWKNIE